MKAERTCLTPNASGLVVGIRENWSWNDFVGMRVIGYNPYNLIQSRTLSS